MTRQTVQERIERWLSDSSDIVFVRPEFNQFGGYSQVGKALRSIIQRGGLVKAGYGIYVKARPSVDTGETIPVVSLLQVALLVMPKLGVKAELGYWLKEHFAGRTTQMPVRTTINVGKARIRRKIGYAGKRMVHYEHGLEPE